MANVNSIELKANLTEPTKPTNQTKQEQWAGIVKPWRDQTYRSSGIGAKWCRSTNWVSGGIRSRRQLQLLLLPTISFPATSLTQQSQQNSYPRCSTVVNLRCPVVGANDAGQVLGGLPLSIWPWASPGEPA